MLELTAEQRRIIEHRGGHARVRAVAGSGKTTTMVERVAVLLARGVEPAHIMVLMFNRSARDAFAAALQKRLAGTGQRAPAVRTFHGLGLRLVESFMGRGALPRYRLVTEEGQRENLARRVGQRLQGQGWSLRDDLEDFLTFIDLVKARLISADELAREIALPEKFSSFIEGYNLFEDLRCGEKIRFYSELINEPVLAMEKDAELRAWVENRVEHIIVDEYQDISTCQQRLLKMVAGARARLMVVGDADQCIYEWRGAKPEYIATIFSQDFPKPRDYSLSFSFRYGHQLSLAANHLIAHNVDESRSLCRSHPQNVHTQIFTREQVAGKSHPLVDIVRDWQGAGRKGCEIAVLVRLYAMSVPVELALLEAGIPYQLEGGRTVFYCPEIMALIGYLRLCDGSMATIAETERRSLVQEMLLQPHMGLKKGQMEQLLLSMVTSPLAAPSLILGLINDAMPAYQRRKLERLADCWQWLLDEPEKARADKVLQRLVARLDLYSFYRDFASRQASGENRIQTCRSLIAFAQERALGVEDFLSEFIRLKNSDNAGSDSLLITSIHRAKGREWPLVILPGLEEGSFPFRRQAKESLPVEEVDDERRLFYVGMTRASEKLWLIHPRDLFLQEAMDAGRVTWSMAGAGPTASCFLYEANLGVSIRVGDVIAHGGDLGSMEAVDADMANAYLQLEAGKHGQVSSRQEVRPVLAVEGEAVVALHERLTASQVHEGMGVVHDRFGPGQIAVVIDRGQGKVRVIFEEEGEMILLLSYAKLYRRRDEGERTGRKSMI